MGNKSQTASVSTIQDKISTLSNSIGEAKSNTQLLGRMRAICQEYGLKHTTYHNASLPGATFYDPFLLLTYPENWVGHYKEHDYVNIDPAVVQALSSVVPVDWSNIPRRARKVKRLFGEAAEFGVGMTGMTVPIHSPQGISALFSVSSDLPQKEWEEFTEFHTAEIMYLAHLVHERVTALNGEASNDNMTHQITVMELNCLRWIAEGLTMSEVAEKLSLSERSVRMYLTSARYKLDAKNTIQAVVKLMKSGEL